MILKACLILSFIYVAAGGNVYCPTGQRSNGSGGCTPICPENTHFSGRTCKCDDTWYGARCHERCPHPKKVINNHTCKCGGQTFGQYCEHTCRHGRVNDICVCTLPYYGFLCDQHCPDYGQKRVIHNDQCLCKHPWFGNHCNERCIHGTAEQNRCVCHKGWIGRTCNKNCAHNNPNSHAVRGVCVCKHPYYGNGCSNRCNENNGEIKDNKCYCKTGYWGEGCHKECRDYGFKRIVDRFNRCVCFGQFFGPNCEKDCHHGRVEGDQCTCFPPYYGEKCDRRCVGYGQNRQLRGNQCVCSEYRFGPNCEHYCYHGTLEHGRCRCHFGYFGTECADLCMGIKRKMVYGLCKCNENGYFGKHCQKCHHGRVSADGLRCECDNNWYGTSCHHHCNSNQRYDRSTEECECKGNNYGQTCSKTCTHGVVRYGTCTCEGNYERRGSGCDCKLGYYGPNCSKTCTHGSVKGGRCVCTGNREFDSVFGKCRCKVGYWYLNYRCMEILLEG